MTPAASSAPCTSHFAPYTVLLFHSATLILFHFPFPTFNFKLSTVQFPMPRPSPTPAVLTSRDNKWLKDFRQALRGGEPTQTGAVGVEGVRLVEEALSSNCPIEAVLFSEKGERHREKLAALIARRETTFPVLRTTDRLFEALADTEHPQGVAALVTPRKFEISDVFSANENAAAPLILVLAGLQDPGNVGTILRTAAAFGATAAIATATTQNGTASPFAPKALRASAGAALHLPTVTGPSLPILLTQCKLNNIRTVASCVDDETAAAVPPWQIDWRQPVALLIGNEGAGLPPEIAKAADVRVHIPIATRIESLNAAAAAAVVLYEAFRQRSGSTP
jgi:TrmH family RNA methyltransferase